MVRLGNCSNDNFSYLIHVIRISWILSMGFNILFNDNYRFVETCS